MLYKPGDVVQVVSTHPRDGFYYNLNPISLAREEAYTGMVDDMKDRGGQSVTIDYIDGSYYRIKEDYGEWVWTDEMFEFGSINEDTTFDGFCDEELVAFLE